MKALTIDELYKALAKARKDGLGKKKILISSDDEGNGFHECFFAVTPITEDFVYANFGYGVDIRKAMDEYVIIG